jgi:hypothetical protein
VVVGGGSAEDNDCCSPQTFPDPTRPNNVLAPYWSDLSLDAASGGGAIRVGSLTDGTTSWLVVEWDAVQAWDAAAAGPANSFQVWIQLGDTEGQWFTYGDLGGVTSPLSVGAENRDGSSGVNLDPADIASSPDWTITTSAPKAGGSVTIPYEAYGKKAGTYTITATLTADTMNAAAKQAVTLHVTK